MEEGYDKNIRPSKNHPCLQKLKTNYHNNQSSVS